MFRIRRDQYDRLNASHLDSTRVFVEGWLGEQCEMDLELRKLVEANDHGHLKKIATRSTELAEQYRFDTRMEVCELSVALLKYDDRLPLEVLGQSHSRSHDILVMIALARTANE